MLDNSRAGPVSDLEKCSILLAKTSRKAAEVLVIGSSRIGVAIDPIAMQDLLRVDSPDLIPSVERIAIPINPLRPATALLETYIKNRGAPEVVIFEPAFLSQRSVKNLEENHGKKDAEQYIFTRDMGILNYRQILNLPSVAMPYSRKESIFIRLHLVIRGILIRSGMLLYEFFHRPFREWDLASCGDYEWRKGGMAWPDDFQFSYSHSRHSRASGEVVESMKNSMKQKALSRLLKNWQKKGSEVDNYYAFDFESNYRAGEVKIFEDAVKLAKENEINLIIQPLPLFGTTIHEKDKSYLRGLGDHVFFYDLYAEAGSILDTFWYNPSHILPESAGIYTTALMANYITTSRMLYRD